MTTHSLRLEPCRSLEYPGQVFLIIVIKKFSAILCKIDLYAILIRLWTIRPVLQGFLF